MRNRDLRPAAKANPTIQQAFERFQKYNRLKNLSQGSLDFYAAKGRSFFRFLGDTGDEWLSIQKKEPIVEEKYILCYFLGNNPPHREFAKRLKEVTGCKIIALTHLDEFVKSDEGYADETPYDIDPADFLNLIRNAEYVCTDSFHCSVFSILYKRQFFTFRRYNRNTKQSTNSRLDTLFNMAGITGRLLTGEENIVDCLKIETDFESVHKKLEGIRQKSYEYLLTALKDEGSTDL